MVKGSWASLQMAHPRKLDLEGAATSVDISSVQLLLCSLRRLVRIKSDKVKGSKLQHTQYKDTSR